MLLFVATVAIVLLGFDCAVVLWAPPDLLSFTSELADGERLSMFVLSTDEPPAVDFVLILFNELSVCKCGMHPVIEVDEADEGAPLNRAERRRILTSSAAAICSDDDDDDDDAGTPLGDDLRASMIVGF